MTRCRDDHPSDHSAFVPQTEVPRVSQRRCSIGIQVRILPPNGRSFRAKAREILE